MQLCLTPGPADVEYTARRTGSISLVSSLVSSRCRARFAFFSSLYNVSVRLLRILMGDLVNPESGEEMIWLQRVKAMLSCTLVPLLCVLLPDIKLNSMNM